MSQNNCNTKSNSKKGYRHLTYEDRVKIESFYNGEGLKNKTEIAKGLYRKKNSDLTYSEEYSADKGQANKEKRAKRKGPNLVIAEND